MICILLFTGCVAEEKPITDTDLISPGEAGLTEVKELSVVEKTEVTKPAANEIEADEIEVKEEEIVSTKDKSTTGTDKWMAYNSNYIFAIENDGIYMMDREGNNKERIYPNGGVRTNLLHVTEEHLYIEVWDLIDASDADIKWVNMSNIRAYVLIEMNLDSKSHRVIYNKVLFPTVDWNNGIGFYVASDLKTIMRFAIVGEQDHTIEYTHKLPDEVIVGFTVKDSKINILEVTDPHYYGDTNYYSVNIDKSVRLVSYNDWTFEDNMLPNGNTLLYNSSIGNLILHNSDGLDILVSDNINGSYFVVKDYIYFWERDDYWEKYDPSVKVEKTSTLFRINTDGTDKKSMKITTNYPYPSNIKHTGDYLLYFDQNRYQLFRMDLDCADKTVIYDCFYYSSEIDSYQVYVADNFARMYDIRLGASHYFNYTLVNSELIKIY